MGEQSRARRGSAQDEATASLRHARRSLCAYENAKLCVTELSQIDLTVSHDAKLDGAVERQGRGPGDVHVVRAERARVRQSFDARDEVISGAPSDGDGDTEWRRSRPERNCS